jgi:hypothetical protein
MDPGPNGYQQSVSGWSRKAVVAEPPPAVDCWATVSTPDLSSNSVAVLAYVSVGDLPGELFAFGGGNHAQTSVNGSHDIVLTSPSTMGTGASSLGNVVHPVLTVMDRAHMVFATYTDSEVIIATWDGTVNGTTVVFGSYFSPSPPVSYLYATMWTGAAAEQFDINTTRTMLQNLNWTVAW